MRRSFYSPRRHQASRLQSATLRHTLRGDGNTPAQHAAYSRLSKAQVVALRFASDEGLPALFERAARENLDADQIKRAIKNWMPDWERT
jgi:Family of unknown function (DUF6526)